MSSWRWSSKSVEEVGSSRPADLGAKAQLLDEPMSVSQLGLQRRHLLSAVDVAAIIVAVVVVAEEIGVGVAVSVSCGVAVSSLERRSGSAELGRHCCATRAAEAGLRSCRVVAASAAAVLVWCSQPRIIVFMIIRVVALLLVVVVVVGMVGSVDGIV